MGEDGTGINIVVNGRALGEDGSKPHIRGIHLNNELEFGVRYLQAF